MEIVSRNLTTNEPPWNSTPAWKMPGWAEPLIVVVILFGSMILTRRRGYRIFRRKPGIYTSALDTDDTTCSSDELLGRDESSEDAIDEQTASTKYLPKTRRLLNFAFKTPNTSRFKNNIQSRVLKRFPFLLEMFYWVINYAFYRMTAILSQKVFAGRGIWTVAESHGLAILDFEQNGFLSSLFPRELAIQQWFMHNHQDALSFLNKAYAYIHIPGTVGFIAWYYYVAPSHSTFAKVRRTMNLTNFMAFTTYIFYPCMPPRLLPKEYGFLDTVRHDDGQSVWMSGKYVNSLAAMPSMHFGYALCIGCTMAYHSGTFGGKQKHGATGKTWMWKVLYVGVGVGYPTMILTSIIATANHYFLDALVAMMYVLAAFMSNKVFYVFVPVEDWLFWAVRAERPVPSTGERYRALSRRLHVKAELEVSRKLGPDQDKDEDGVQGRRESLGSFTLSLQLQLRLQFVANSNAFYDAHFRVIFLITALSALCAHQIVTMAEPEVVIDASENNTPAPTQSQDVDMGGQDESTQPENSADPSTEQQLDEPSGLENIEPELPARVTFLDYLKSPIIELSVGKDDNVTLLHAHQRLLEQSPVLADKIAAMTDADNRRIDLPDEDLTATACFLEFLYKNDYFPTLSGSSLETDPEIPVPDTEGMALLRHARVYTLAQHFGVPALATLAHKKIHLTQSTARGEIEYARYVYGHTEVSDESIRKPVAAFWATRSHVLRHEAEKEFRSMCLEFPQFGFDVLSLVLDNQEKRTARSETTIGGGRKRPRVSAV
ncbi:hypothetical protein E4T48_07788 [Aureobasidium sp. EXF-10727]|nr:hypothetical protein E4T48_07788 [Aureobasidium sp. EXF-10727]